MHIKKLRHCAMVIDIPKKGGEAVRVLTDPGIYSLEEHDKVKGVDIVLITHEHADHFHIESLKALIKREPDVQIVTDVGVGTILAKEGVAHHVMEHGDAVDLKGVRIEAYGKDHAFLHESLPPMSNVGFFLENKLFFPGDAFTDPKKPIDVLALPVAGPWMKISEAVNYALEVKPRLAFPVHDAVRIATAHRIPEMILPKNGIEFVKLEEGGELDVR
ncbi:MAG: MBL fold metallo-hydrolase [Patescibacteria group bacterium]|nr:MBL fold metallo-hydrolase [Patescibacteria group bacterium]